MHYVFDAPLPEVQLIASLPEPDNRGWIHVRCPICKQSGMVSLWVSADDPTRTNLTVSCFCEHRDIIDALWLSTIPARAVPS